ncbi:MAG: hypothetical protein AAGI24_04135 [Pseudomonadota bacterium]
MQLAQRFNQLAEQLHPQYEDLQVPEHLETPEQIEGYMRQHGEFLEGMAATILALIAVSAYRAEG